MRTIASALTIFNVRAQLSEVGLNSIYAIARATQYSYNQAHSILAGGKNPDKFLEVCQDLIFVRKAYPYYVIPDGPMPDITTLFEGQKNFTKIGARIGIRSVQAAKVFRGENVTKHTTKMVKMYWMLHKIKE